MNNARFEITRTSKSPSIYLSLVQTFKCFVYSSVHLPFSNARSIGSNREILGIHSIREIDWDETKKQREESCCWGLTLVWVIYNTPEVISRAIQMLCIPRELSVYPRLCNTLWKFMINKTHLLRLKRVLRWNWEI